MALPFALAHWVALWVNTSREAPKEAAAREEQTRSNFRGPRGGALLTAQRWIGLRALTRDDEPTPRQRKRGGLNLYGCMAEGHQNGSCALGVPDEST